MSRCRTTDKLQELVITQNVQQRARWGRVHWLHGVGDDEELRRTRRSHRPRPGYHGYHTKGDGTGEAERESEREPSRLTGHIGASFSHRPRQKAAAVGDVGRLWGWSTPLVFSLLNNKHHNNELQSCFHSRTKTSWNIARLISSSLPALRSKCQWFSTFFCDPPFTSAKLVFLKGRETQQWFTELGKCKTLLFCSLFNSNMTRQFSNFTKKTNKI